MLSNHFHHMKLRESIEIEKHVINLNTVSARLITSIKHYVCMVDHFHHMKLRDTIEIEKHVINLNYHVYIEDSYVIGRVNNFLDMKLRETIEIRKHVINLNCWNWKLCRSWISALSSNDHLLLLFLFLFHFI